MEKKLTASREFTLQPEQYQPVKVFASQTVIYTDGECNVDAEAVLAKIQTEVDNHVRDQARAVRLRQVSISQAVAANLGEATWPPDLLVLPVPEGGPVFYKRIDRHEYQDRVKELHEDG